jgi:hypothetical protein
VSVATVKEQRKIKLFGELQLLFKVFFLNIGFAEVQAIVVEADLSDGNDFVFVFFDLMGELAKVVVGADEELAAACWMCADGAEETI